MTDANFYRSWTLSRLTIRCPSNSRRGNRGAKGNKVELTWTTATETNSDYFTIEKSATGDDFWEEIARVEAAGNSTSETNYVYHDEFADGLAYYRLSQVDVDARERFQHGRRWQPRRIRDRERLG